MPFKLSGTQLAEDQPCQSNLVTQNNESNLPPIFFYAPIFADDSMNNNHKAVIV